MLCTSAFVDDVMFSHNGACGITNCVYANRGLCGFNALCIFELCMGSLLSSTASFMCYVVPDIHKRPRFLSYLNS